ncbi:MULTISPECIES: hypothetical protein [Burkholderia]|uniref:hypothetical protein n=1 Tax=Burkholderia TaxID=32008 RepID=UPI00158E1BC1|nr:MULTISPECIES: hypothetical protein [Burkholderia]MBG0878188.1 hypothetical protein [Burkholderia sp. 9775_39]MBG0882753.1 hypothetical protein [Burkholderia sp. 9773_38]
MRLLHGLMLAAPLVCFAKALARANWLTKMAISSLENAGITDVTKPDESKAKAVLLASEKTGKDLYRQIYDITFVDKSGAKFQIITSSEASSTISFPSDAGRPATVDRVRVRTRPAISIASDCRLPLVAAAIGLLYRVCKP